MKLIVLLPIFCAINFASAKPYEYSTTYSNWYPTTTQSGYGNEYYKKPYYYEPNKQPTTENVNNCCQNGNYGYTTKPNYGYGYGNGYNYDWNNNNGCLDGNNCGYGSSTNGYYNKDWTYNNGCKDGCNYLGYSNPPKVYVSTERYGSPNDPQTGLTGYGTGAAYGIGSTR